MANKKSFPGIFLKLKCYSSAWPKLAFFWHWSSKNITNRWQCVQFQKPQKFAKSLHPNGHSHILPQNPFICLDQLLLRSLWSSPSEPSAQCTTVGEFGYSIGQLLHHFQIILNNVLMGLYPATSLKKRFYSTTTALSVSLEDESN